MLVERTECGNLSSDVHPMPVEMNSEEMGASKV